jgi:hypothetical protein
MKYLHHLTILLFSLILSSSQFAFGQDTDKENTTSEEGAEGAESASAVGGDAAGGGDAAAPAAGGESAAAPAAAAPAAAAPAAAAPAAAAPAAAAAAPTFDMGSAMTSSVAAPPPASVSAESNPIATVVKISAASGGVISLNDALKIGVSNIKRMAANKKGGGAVSFENLTKNIVVSSKIVKSFGGFSNLDDLDDILDQVDDFDTDELDSFQVLTLEELDSLKVNSEGGEFSISDIGKVATKSKEAKTLKSKGISLSKERLDDLNKKYTDDFLTIADEWSLDSLDFLFDDIGVDGFSSENADSFVEKATTVNEAIKSGGSLEAIKAERSNSVLLDSNGLALVVKSGDSFAWAKGIESQKRSFYGVWQDIENDSLDGLGVMSLKLDSGKHEAMDILGFDYGDQWTESITRVSDSVLLFQGKNDEGVVDEAFYLKVMKDSAGNYIFAALSFDSDNSPEDEALGRLSYSNINSDASKKVLDSFLNAKSTTDLPEGVDLDMKLFSTYSDAVSFYNTIFDKYGEVVLKDSNGKSLVVQFGTEDNPRYTWARDLDGATLTTVSGSKYTEAEYETISLSSNTWTNDDPKPETGKYENLGSVLKVYDGENFFFARILKDEHGFRLLDFTPEDLENWYDEDDWDAFLWDRDLVYYTRDSIDGSGSIEYGADVEYLVGTEEEKKVIYDLLLDFYNSHLEEEAAARKAEEDAAAAAAKKAEEEAAAAKKAEEEAAAAKKAAEEAAAAAKKAEEEAAAAKKAEEEAAAAIAAIKLSIAQTEDSDLGLDTEEKEAFNKYIGDLYDDGLSQMALENTIALLNITMLNRDLHNIDLESLEDFLDDLEDIDVPETYISLVKKVNLIGDSKQDKVDDFLAVLLRDGVLDENNLNTDAFSLLLDDFLGDNRGWLSNNSESRTDDFSDDLDYTLFSKGLNVSALVSHELSISGDISDSVQNEDAVDLTILASGRDTIIGKPGDGSKQYFKISPADADEADNDAYLIASADELYLREPWTSTEAHERSYADPAKLDISVDHSSLALASLDEMNLVNVDISTGGGLAIATLDELNIWSTDNSDPNVFEPGVGGNDFESLYLYAEEHIDIQGLNIIGRVDDIYMESKTINLYDVTFPNQAAVLLRSQNGGLNILNDGGTHAIGDVNFNNVRHLGIKSGVLVNNDFKETNLGFKSNKTPLSSGRAHIEVQGFTR